MSLIADNLREYENLCNNDVVALLCVAAPGLTIIFIY